MKQRPRFPLARIVLLAATFLGISRACAADPAVRISPDDPTSIQRGIDAAYQSGAKTVVIPPGVYRLPNPETGNYHLSFADFKDFTIDATGVTFIPTQREKRGILLRNSENVTLRGLTLLREIPPFSQGKIVAIATDRSSVDIRIDQGYPTDLDDKKFFPRIPIIDLYRAGTHELKPLVPDLYLDRVTRRGPDLFEFHFRAPLPAAIPVAIGDPAAWRGPEGADFSLWEDKGIVLEDVTVKSGTGLTFMEIAGEGGNRYQRCVITYAPKPVGATAEPLLAGGVDGLHSASVRHGPTLEDCAFDSLDDDAVNIHGSFAMLMEARDRTIVVDWRSPHTGGRVPLQIGRPGDELRLYDRSGALRTEARIVSIGPIEGYTPGDLGPIESRKFKDREHAQYFEVRLDRAVTGEPGGFVSNPAQDGDGFVIRRCTFRNNRGHGIWARSDHGLIERCTIEGTLMGGIMVAPEISSWNESDYVRHLVIQDNTFRNVGVGEQPWNGTVTIAAFEYGKYVPLPGGHRDVIVRRNTFEGNRGPNIVVSSIIGLRLEDNRFVRPMDEPAFKVEPRGWDNPGAVIWIRHASDVTMKGNVVVDPGQFYKTALDMDATVGGTDLAAGISVAKP